MLATGRLVGADMGRVIGESACRQAPPERALLWAGDFLKGWSSSRLAAHGKSFLKGNRTCCIHGPEKSGSSTGAELSPAH